MNLERKLESALKIYLEGIFTDITVYDGHGDEEIVDIPSLIVSSESSTNHPEMPTSARIRIVNTAFKIYMDSQDEDARAQLDAWEQLLESSTCAESLKDALNVPSVGIDTRQIKGLHIYDATFEQGGEEFEDANWVFSYTFQITCQPFDELS